MKVVPGPASRELGLKISDLLGIKATPLEFKHFPDGESYIRFSEEIQGEDVVIVQSTGPPQDSNLLHLLLLVDAAKDIGAETVTAVVPYVAYGRQEKRYRSGEAISSKTVFKLLKTIGVDSLISVDFHSPSLASFGNCFTNITAMPELAKYMTRYGLVGAFSLAPDDGALEYVKATSKILQGDFGWLDKTRDRITGEVETELKALDVRDKDVVIFDDIISTGSTMVKAIRTAKEQGARRIFVACVHPLLVGGAKERILQGGASMIVGTDSIQSSVSVVSLAPPIVEVLKEWLR